MKKKGRSADSATLLNIALQNPTEGGTAVYNARVMLDLPIDYFGLNSQRFGQKKNNATIGSDMIIYPNPASESVNLEYGIYEGQNAQLEIFDLSGKLVLTKKLVKQQEVYSIETSLLQAGVYMLRIVVDGEATEVKRLIIVK